MVRRMSVAITAIAVLCFAGGSLAAPITYAAFLDGPSEEPPNDSPGIGRAVVTIDLEAHTLHVVAEFSGLLGTTTAAHIHIGVPTGPVATQVPFFIGFPIGVTEGGFFNTYDTLDEATYRPGFITDSGGTVEGAEAALAAGLANGTAYFNIHTTVVPAGEIRGFLQAVPEPSTMAMAGLGFLGLAGYGWRRRGRTVR